MQHTIEVETVTDAVFSTWKRCFNQGLFVAGRGGVTRECLNTTIHIAEPAQNLFVCPQRKLNYRFLVAEWLWMMTGQNNAALILPFNSKLEMALDDKNLAFSGAYGPPITEQLDYVLDTLRSSTHSRQAVISVWRPRPRSTRDVPCTLTFQFHVRDGAVHMTTTMRSNDVWLGLPYDLFNFTQIQKFIAATLGYTMGSYVHHVGSMHMYLDNEQSIDQCLSQWATTYAHSRQYPASPYPTDLPQPPSLIALLDILVTVSRAYSRPNRAAVDDLYAQYQEYSGLLTLLTGARTRVEQHTLLDYIFNSR